MNDSFLGKITIEKSLIYIAIIAVVIVCIFLFYLFFSSGTKSIQVTSPNNGKEEWQIGETYQITWQAKGIERVGIVLFKENEPEWIAKNVSANSGKYEWEIYPGHRYGSGFWIAVFEYPCEKGKKIDYSNASFAITYPELASCEWLSIQNEWPYLPNDYPNLRRVFITKETYTGNLEGLEGTDKKCQAEADAQNSGGKWHAFLGGDGDSETAMERLKETPRQTDGIFIDVFPSATLIRGATCHRLLGRDFNEFLNKFSNPPIVNEKQIENSFLENMKNIWLGRIDEKSKKNCIPIQSVLSAPYKKLAEKYSFTTTCQSWTKESELVEGYPVLAGQPKISFPTCYTSGGQFTEAVALGGLASGLTSNATITFSEGKYCNTRQKLLCIEE